MTVMDFEDPAAPEPLTDDERAEAMAHDALVHDLSVVLMRLDGNDGDPHQLVWCGGAVPEPWGDVWQKYEPQALSVLDAIGDASARALVEALGEREWVARVVSSGPLANLPCLEWRSAEVSLSTPIGTKLYLASRVQEVSAGRVAPELSIAGSQEPAVGGSSASHPDGEPVEPAPGREPVLVRYAGNGQYVPADGVAVPQRPERFEFAMDVLGDPEATELRAYIEALERALSVALPSPALAPHLPKVMDEAVLEHAKTLYANSPGAYRGTRPLPWPEAPLATRQEFIEKAKAALGVEGKSHG